MGLTAYKRTANNFNATLMNRRQISHLTPLIHKVFQKLNARILSCRLPQDLAATPMLPETCSAALEMRHQRRLLHGTAVNADMKGVCMMDMVKFYASCMARLPFLASISLFDKFQIYNNEAIDETCLYVVEFSERDRIYNSPFGIGGICAVVEVHIDDYDVCMLRL